ncbi:MAG TPA: hypothetical protein VKA43_08670, partial [Gammaproteobacteria bacterium]|nr:hypothetical protein [Gammaproteobacteria bacterium]
MNKSTQQLGALDPERKNSPVAWEADEDTETLRELVPDEAVCFFNDVAYDHDTVVESGTVLLRCDHGLWVPAGVTEESKP